jgi:hypothetical protein
MANIDPIYWLVSILWPQRMFVVYDLTLLEGCTQAIWERTAFQNRVDIESFQRVYF